MSKATDVEGMVRTCVDTYGRLDILLNNAGVLGKWGPVAELDEADYDKIMNVDLKGVWLCMKYAIPVMVKTGGGSIVNVASHVAYQPQIGSGIYCAAKAGVIQLSRVAALEYIKRNIRVNSVEPGYVLTPMANAHFTAEPGGMEKVGRKRLWAGLVGWRRLPRQCYSWASDDFTYTTGFRGYCGWRYTSFGLPDHSEAVVVMGFVAFLPLALGNGWRG